MEGERPQSKIELKMGYFSNNLSQFIQLVPKQPGDDYKTAARLMESGNIKEAIIIIERCFSKDTAKETSNPLYLCKLCYNIGMLLSKYQVFSHSNQYLKKAILNTNLEQEMSLPLLFDSYFALGNNYFNSGRFHEASILYEKAIEIKLKDSNECHSDLQEIYTNIGIIYFKQNKYKKAIEKLEKALIISKKFKVEQDFSIGILYGLIGNCLSYLKDPKGLTMLVKGVQILVKDPKQNKESLVIDFFSSSIMLIHFENLDEGSKLLLKAIQTAKLNSSPVGHKAKLHLQLAEMTKAQNARADFSIQFRRNSYLFFLIQQTRNDYFKTH